MADGDARPRTLCVPAAALHALRGALLGAAGGELQLRDAGYVAGLAMYDDFAADVRDAEGVEPDALPLPRFTAALGAYLEASGWGAARLHAPADGDLLRVAADDWVEGEAGAGATYPACHFSTGLLAGFFGRAARQSLAVLEVACRSAGAERCEFAVGSREVMDRLWAELRAHG